MKTPPKPPPRNSSITSPSNTSKLEDSLEALSTACPSSYPVIPLRSSSTRHKQPWQPSDAKRSRKQLERDISSLNDEIGKKAKRLRPSTSYDSDFWTANAEISRLCQQRASKESRLHFLESRAASPTGVSVDNWHAEEQAQNLERQILAYRQAEEIAKKQASRLQESRTGLSAIFFSLFTSSPQGLGIKTGVGRREPSEQSTMVQRMKEEYCPDAADGSLWDPIIGRWELKGRLHAAHLYAWRQVESMDAIFGLGAKEDIFSPLNGLFLSEEVEKALDRGLLAIVPDVDFDPKDSSLPQADLPERNELLRAWEEAPVKEYKIIVLDQSDERVNSLAWRDEGGELRAMAELDGRPLRFHTDFRPRARYVWWTFMNAVLQTAWRQKQNEKNILRQEVAKATRYWGTRGRYVKKNMLRGFVDELGHDIESILENAIEEDGDNNDANPEAVAVMASETVFRMRRAAAKDEDSDEDTDDEDEEDQVA